MLAAEFFLKRVDAGLVDAVHHADHFGLPSAGTSNVHEQSRRALPLSGVTVTVFR